MTAHYDPKTHPLRLGETVSIFSLFIFKHPFFEGRAEIVGWVPAVPNLYRVVFEGERRVYERFAHPGKWQTDPDGMLRELLDHWRQTVTPEIANEFFPNDPPPNEIRAPDAASMPSADRNAVENTGLQSDADTKNPDEPEKAS